MPYVPDDPRYQQQGQQGGGAGAPVTTTSAPGAGPSAPGGQATAANQTPAQPFTNIQAYLTANAPQLQNEADTIAGNLGTQYGNVQQGIQDKTAAFAKDVASGYTPEDKDLVARASSNPTETAGNQTDVDAFQKQLNDAYKGPSSFEGSNYYADLNKDVQKANSDAALLKTPSGLQTYFQGLDNNSTQGDNILDQVLISGSPEAYGKIADAAKAFDNLPTQLSSVIPTQNQAVTDAQSAASKASENAGTSIGNTIQQWQGGLNAKVMQNENARAAYNASIASGRSKAQAAQDAINAYLQKAGVSVDNPVSSYFSNQPVENPVTLAQTASAQDYAEQEALNKLIGGDLGFLNPADASQAGTAPNIPGNIPSLNPLIEQFYNNLAKGQWSTPGGQVILRNGGTGSVDDPAFARFGTDRTALRDALSKIDPNYAALTPTHNDGTMNLMDWARTNGLI